MGAGVIPVSVVKGKTYFLFQKSFSGRKVGHLIDFGGGLGANETYRQTAIREFVEETDTLYFSSDPRRAARTAPEVAAQIRVVDALFDETLGRHPDWWRRRIPGEGPTPKDWVTFFVQFPFRNLTVLNEQWANDRVGRFKKRRELLWVSADQLIEIYDRRPQLLWKRVRQLQNAPELITTISQCLRPPG